MDTILCHAFGGLHNINIYNLIIMKLVERRYSLWMYYVLTKSMLVSGSLRFLLSKINMLDLVFLSETHARKLFLQLKPVMWFTCRR